MDESTNGGNGEIVEGKLNDLACKMGDLMDGMDTLKIQMNKSQELEAWDDEPTTPKFTRKVEIIKNTNKPTPVFTIPRAPIRYQINRHAEKGKSKSLKGACAYCNKQGHHIETCWKLQNRNGKR